MRRLQSLFIGLVLSISGGVISVAQTSIPPLASPIDLDRYLAENALPIRLSDGGVDGAGGDWLVDAADGRFLLFGEQHGVAGAPTIIAGVAARTSPDVMVLETDPWMADRFTTEPIDTVLQDAPYSLAFNYDDEVALLRSLKEIAGIEMWGVDQPTTAIHPFETMSKTTNHKRIYRGLMLKAALKAGEYLRQDHTADFARLTQRIAQSDMEQAHLDRLSESMAIYNDHRAGDRAKSAAAREAMMHRHFTDAINDYQGRSGSLPELMLKMGGAHVTKTTEPNDIPSLGDRVEADAALLGVDARHVAIYAYRAEAWPQLAEITQDQEVAGWLIDMQALRATVPEERLTTLTQQAQSTLRGYDAVILVTPGERDGRSYVRTQERAWRTSTLTALGLAIWPVIIILLALAIWIIDLLWRLIKNRGMRSPAASILVGLSVASLGLIAAQIRAILSAQSGAASLGPNLFGPLLLALSILIGLALLFQRVTNKTKTQRPAWVLLIWAAALIWLSVGLYLWNFGGMI
ncbi:MAG: hypothetical protein ACSHX3_11440 [Litorimonas sp.]